MLKPFLFEGNGRSGVIFTGTASAGSFATVFNNNAAKSVAEYFSNNASADSRYLSKPFSSRSLSMVSTAALNCPLNASFSVGGRNGVSNPFRLVLQTSQTYRLYQHDLSDQYGEHNFLDLVEYRSYRHE